METVEESRSWWVFDRPLARDPMAWLAVAVWIAWFVWGRNERVTIGPVGRLVEAVLMAPWVVYGVGVVAGSVREFHRGVVRGPRGG